jgi:hypothetical protein
MLALAMQRRSAADELGVVAGDQVVLSPFADDVPPAAVTSPVVLRSR